MAAPRAAGHLFSWFLIGVVNNLSKLTEIQVPGKIMHHFLPLWFVCGAQACDVHL